MSTTRYRPLSGTARLIAAATAAIVTLATFAAVAAGLTGVDASQQWLGARRASTDAVQPLWTVRDLGRRSCVTSTTGSRPCSAS